MQAIIELILYLIFYLQAQVLATNDPHIYQDYYIPESSVYAAEVPSQLTEAQLVYILIEVGWPQDWIPEAVSIVWCESKYSPGAIGDGGQSLGLFQLWIGWFLEGEDPFNPYTNAAVALRVRQTRGRFGGAGGWTCATLWGIP